ncbi:thiol-disulfide oxidoreductase DCC family protein [Aquirufa sp.]|jgi:predicted DCC family thiol-disulfide oxidoreductase YuxK|uniref:thiol-disulfide oxidoreductase DCC family protein n=1 Tax=Aquirufa sp. TaxID=2676249 RepID=UPI0037C1719F
MGGANSLVVFIDGDCGFCQWASGILRRISAEELAIYPQSTALCKSYQEKIPDSRWSLATVQVVTNGRLYIKSAAIAEVLKHAKWPFLPLRVLFVLPERLLDRMYDFVAKHRYFFNGKEACEINSQG